jgi:archaellum component FlaC
VIVRNLIPQRNRVRSLRPTAGEGSVPPIAVVLLIGMALLVGATLYLYLELRSTRNQMVEQFDQYNAQLAQLEGSVSRTSRTVDTSVEEVKGMMATASKQIDEKTQKVEQRVLGRTQTLAKDLEQTKAQQQAALRDVGGKLNNLEQVATTTDSRVGSLTEHVDTVKTEVDKNREELEKAIKDLKTVRGDLGVQSGLIATNGEEVAALRRLGERDYYEFDLTKTKQPVRVGNVRVKLRKADMKRQKFTLELYADDKKIEKKDKTLLEPVQFYVIGSRIPYELVVNKVEKNRIVGYIATPKTDAGARKTAAAASSSD